MAAEAIKAGGRIGPYELLAPIGAGGMGEVWKARDNRLDRLVAIKFSQAQFTERFEREARAIAALNHPNIAQIYDVGENYIVMEYVDGEPVRSPDSTRKLLDIAVQIADGLAAAHAAGFVHRDLKPDNILIAKSGRVKILDFGLAKPAAAATAAEATQTIAVTNPGTIVGTAAYMSPEQARGQEVDARSDQFSLGLILYELATHKRAFQRDSAAETMAAIICEDPEPLPPKVPAPLRWTISRLLAKESEERYASTRDLFAELRALRAGLSEISAVPVSAPASKTPRVTRVVAACTGLLAIGAIAVLLRTSGSRPSQSVNSRYRFTPFAATAANETTPVWSPDGRTIAYLETVDNSASRLMIKSVDRGTAPVTLAQGNLRNFSWSPDGERIYYSTNLQGGGAVLSVARAGGHPAPLSNLQPSTDAKKGYYAPALSPDGKTLAVVEVDFSRQPSVRRLMFSSPPGAMPRAVGEPLPCCGETALIRWSPDGSRLLVRTSPPEEATTLRTISPDGHAKVLMRLPVLVHPGFSWVGGSRYFVMASDSSDGEDQGLHLRDADSGQITPLLPSATRLMWPSASQDGTRIAYVTRSRLYDLLEIPASGEAARRLAPSQLDQHSVAFSPNRDEFAFVRLNRMVVRNRELNHERVLVSADDYPAAVSTPSFSHLEYSPSGERIVFTCSGCEKELSLWTVPVAGGSPGRLAGGGDGGYGATWSPDEQWIAYHTTQSNRLGGTFAKLRVGSGEKPVYIGVNPSCSFPSWSPSGEWILCRGRELRLLSPDGEKVRPLGDTAGGYAWSRDGRVIYNTRRVEKGAVLERLDPATGRAEKVSDLPADFLPSSPTGFARLSVSMDGRSLAISVRTGDSDIWILDGFDLPGSFWERLWPRKQ